MEWDNDQRTNYCYQYAKYAMINLINSKLIKMRLYSYISSLSFISLTDAGKNEVQIFHLSECCHSIYCHWGWRRPDQRDSCSGSPCQAVIQWTQPVILFQSPIEPVTCQDQVHHLLYGIKTNNLKKTLLVPAQHHISLFIKSLLPVSSLPVTIPVLYVVILDFWRFK